MLNYYLNIGKYDVSKDLEKEQSKKDLYEYKKKVLETNGFLHLVELLPNIAPQFTHTKYDEEGIEEAIDVDDDYPISYEDEKKEIISRTDNLSYLGAVHHNFEYCRTKCKIADQRLRNFTLYPKENQMCVTDCMNVREELSNERKPGSDGVEKTFVWLA